MRRVGQQMEHGRKTKECCDEQNSSVVQNNSAVAEETSAVSEELSTQSVSLEDMLERFVLRDRR